MAKKPLQWTAAATQIKGRLAACNGTENHYSHPMARGYSYTDGVMALANEAEAHWLVDLVFSHQTNRRVRCERFQSWRLAVNADGTAVASMTDGNDGPTIAKQRISYTDFPLPEVALYLENGVLMLPSER